MQRVIVLLALVPALSFATWVVGGDQLTGGKRALDLPTGGPGSSDETEEDAPESISFYGSEYEGDSFFWCFHAFNF